MTATICILLFVTLLNTLRSIQTMSAIDDLKATETELINTTDALIAFVQIQASQIADLQALLVTAPEDAAKISAMVESMRAEVVKIRGVLPTPAPGATARGVNP